MSAQNTSLVERLCQVGSPRQLANWASQDGYYVAACRVAADDVPGLIDLARKWTDWDWPGSSDLPDAARDDAEFLPVTAWRTLADLKSDAAVQPLIEMLREAEYDDDWLLDDLPHVFGKIGESAVDPLKRLAKDTHAEEYIRSTAARGLRCVADHHAATRDTIVAFLTEMMAAAAGDVRFNTTLLGELVDLQAVEAAEPIERAFAGDLLDVGLMGDWEVVRRRLGVEGLGLKMPEKPYNSIERLRARLGMGIFSDRPIFMHGEIDDEAAEAYCKRAYDTFSKSSEAQQVIGRYGDLGWFRMLLNFGLNYLGETVDVMSLASVTEFVLDYVPRKVSTEPDAAESIVWELARFWAYLDRVYQLPRAKSIVEWLSAEGLVGRLKSELSDSSNFGMAKSMFMMGNEAGYDMTSEAGAAEFMMAYNQSLLANQTAQAASPVVQKQRVGRNDPCPCGSGKKFKKCCR